ncbi:MAG: cation diffusion facilitator family transporter [Prevotella sp.]|nr:cation diffusion facilitator family transporter [Prevotella sp.]MDD7045548.1 cation diffusion facilitator family transporter [Prevotella sp.]MDY5546154.1 cation diffusion facilitator family transporter [Prevotella sp.]
MEIAKRERKIYRVTFMGGLVNVVLLVFKFVAGILGGSAAMIADAVHSLSDFASDIVVLVLVKLGSKPQDEDYDYGHGKFETLASVIIGLALLLVGVMLAYSGVVKIYHAFRGEVLPQPGVIAFVAALVSIALKEWAFQFTVRVGRQVNSEAVVANAWHHRSDALSSIGTAVGIGGAILLGSQFSVLDPIAAVVVSFFIVKTAYGLISNALGELLEKSLSPDMEEEIKHIAESEESVSEVHHLQTRRIGNGIAIEMHVRIPGETTLYTAHQHATSIERKLKARFGEQTHIGLHVEPVKIDGHYQAPEKNN